ncbi:MAG: flagellar hook basal-body protein [Vampirovibrionales bacterium]|nr:flagellar hook basal-body protein [Vampirovibrionales bacterium]
MIQSIIEQASHNAKTQFNVLDHIAGNIGNMSTNGYKAKRFEQYLGPSGVLMGVTRIDTTQGALMQTNRALDIAIEGRGYLPVTQADGQTAYTRDGRLAINAQGYLVTAYGDVVGEGIQIPTDYERLYIQKDGTVEVLKKAASTREKIGQIRLVTFENPEGLEKAANNKLVPTADSGAAKIAAANDTAAGEIHQQKLEQSNVQPFDQIGQTLRLNASVISNLRIIKFSDDIYRQAVNLKQ